MIGISNQSASLSAPPDVNAWAYNGTNGQKFHNSASTAYGATYGNGDIVGIALDMDAGTITFYKNGATQGQAFSGLGGQITPTFWQYAGYTWTANFGQRTFYGTDGAGTLPTGYLALSENNITVDDQNLESPDFVWIKNRSAGDSHQLYDSVRGVQKVLLSDPDAPPAEADAPNGLLDFNANGFTIGSQNEVNTLNEDYVAWTWKAGGTPSTITAGSISTGPDVPSIPSSVSANTESGFSIVSYTGNSTVGATIGHGLNQAPDFMIIKSRDDTNSWTVYSSAIGNTGALFLEGTAGTNTNIAFWNNTSPTSTVFTTHSNAANNSSSNDYIAYCFHSVDGFSKFGSYVGGGTSFPFVYTGFRPAFVMIKATSGSENWNIVDTMRDPFNGAKKLLFASATTVNAVATNGVDLLANGFKPRDNIGNYNSSGVTYIYMAFAENPFKYSNAR